MRLLEYQSNGGFRLTGRIADDDIPRYPYAILSHTWEPESEEVIFEDPPGKARGLIRIELTTPVLTLDSGASIGMD